MVAVFASGLVTETSGLYPEAVSTRPDIVINTYNEDSLVEGGTSTERIFKPGAFYATGVGVVQGSLVAVSGTARFLEVSPTGSCSVVPSARDIIIIKNEEQLGGYIVHFGTPAIGGEKGITSTVDKVDYDDVYFDMSLRPQGQALMHTGGVINTLIFVASTGRLLTTNPRATVSYTLFPR